MKSKTSLILLPFTLLACLAGEPNYNNLDPNGEQGGSGGQGGEGGQLLLEECICDEVVFAQTTCFNDVCVIDVCLEGFGDCNGINNDGCEADLRSCGGTCEDCGY